MNDLATVSAAPAHLDWRGKIYTVSRHTLGVRGQLTAWVHQQVWSRVKRLRDDNLLSAGEHAALVERTADSIASGHYDYGGRGSSETLATVDGLIQQVWMSIRRQHPEFTPAEAEAMLDELGAETVGAAMKAANDPPRGPSAPTPPTGPKS